MNMFLYKLEKACLCVSLYNYHLDQRINFNLVYNNFLLKINRTAKFGRGHFSDFL